MDLGLGPESLTTPSVFALCTFLFYFIIFNLIAFYYYLRILFDYYDLECI
jgi:hypothetical protein